MLSQKSFQNAAKSVGCTPSGSLTVHREWSGDTCRLSLTNSGAIPTQVKEVCVFSCDMPYPADTSFYGEGYSKLSQYRGTLSVLENITHYSDAGHYKLPQADGWFTVYNLLMLYPERADIVLLGFASCHRFCGEFRFNSESLEVVLDCEGLTVAPGETLELEEFFVATGENREALLTAFGSRIAANHPRLAYPAPPTGWCSWYCYGPAVTEQDVFDNLAAIKETLPELEFIQLDDGYQKHMGDWLQQHPNFPRPIKDLCLKIKDSGFEPAIWVAPFIAEADSDLLRDHPDWFVKDDTGQPLPSNRDSFGGWRFGPWYMLDGTHPGAQDYLRHVFSTMRREWQCRYFKLDANMWGALPFGHHYDPNATRVDAYRAGMEAILEGAGENCFLLGCNAPMWPSIGAVHGMRISGDISRSWGTFRNVAEECFNRNWQNDLLWHNDPDCLVLQNLETRIVGPDGKPMVSSTGISDHEFAFHAAFILASGGMILASDRMMELGEQQLQTIRKLLPPGGQAAVFDDRQFRIGRIPTEDGEILCLFNWGDHPSQLSVPLAAASTIMDYWTGEVLASKATRTPVISLPGRSARVLTCTRTSI